MSEYGTDTTTPVGRIVWGHPCKPRGKKERSGPTKGAPKLDAKGQQIQEVSFGVAFTKADFQTHIWPVMAAEIATGYPNNVPGRFAYKFVDGDTVDGDGNPYSLKEGYAGHIVLAYTQQINENFGIPPVWKFNQQTGLHDVIGAGEIKRGDYVMVGTNFKVHVASGSDDTPSIYVNPKGIELIGYGTEIVGADGVNPGTMFAGAQRVLPPGASAVPLQSTGAPSMPGMGAPPAMPGNVSAPAALAMPPAMTASAGIAAPVASAPAMPAPAAPPPPPPPPVQTGPQRPTDPAHVHNNGNGTEQWFVNGAWDGQAHPLAAAAPPPPPPAMDFVAHAGYTPPAMPGMPAPR